MKLVLESPTVLRLEGFEAAPLNRLLTYRDKRVDFELKKFKHAFWFINTHGQEAFDAKLAELKAAQVKSLLFTDDRGLWTYSGLLSYLQEQFPQATTENLVKYPESGIVPWAKAPTRIPREYQLTAIKKLLEARHGAVEIGTGLGKSFAAVLLTKELSLPTLVMAPSISIAEQLYDDFRTHFGKQRVGKFFDGKKEIGKLITVAVAASLTKVVPESDAANFFGEVKVFIADESHLVAASTLSQICLELVANAPYRFFFSGTQLRNDGLDKLLEAITGEVVFRMSVREGVDQGYLARPKFRMIKTTSDSSFDSRDVNAMTRAHLYYSDRVNRIAGDIANKSVSLLGHQVLILIDELEQFSRLLPHLRHQVGFAHGGTTAENRGNVPVQYQKSDHKQLVAAFNAGKLPILVGTSCVSTGTDIQTVKTMIYLKGGKSEIEVSQGVGRCTRKPEGKTECQIWDFDITNIETLSRHSKARAAIYESIMGPVQTVTYT
jgi:superfamily II DNA or RNA helicase